MPPIALAAALGAALQPAGPAPEEIYRKAAPSVVGVRALAPVLGERSGTGVVLTREGLILTSASVCPEGASRIRVWTRGPRRYDGELVAVSPRDEIALVRIRPGAGLEPLPAGSSSDVRVGDVCYTIGNAANSIILDDQPSFSAGIVSGFYVLSEERAGSTWRGPVLETTAAVAVGMEGAPCLDRRGRMIGLVTLNYSPHRFLGAVIPADEIRPAIERLLREASGKTAEAPPPAGEGNAGFTLADRDGRVVVEEVAPGGPAERAGLRRGDVLREAAGAPATSAREVRERLGRLRAGAVVWLRVEVDGTTLPVRIVLEGGERK